MKILTREEKVDIAKKLFKELINSNEFEKFLDYGGYDFIESFMEMSEKDIDDEKAQDIRMTQVCDILGIVKSLIYPIRL